MKWSSIHEIKEEKSCSFNPDRTKSIFWLTLKVWTGHCGCNIYPKNLKFLVNMWFSTSFKIQ
jgi:hypothetical protein